MKSISHNSNDNFFFSHHIQDRAIQNISRSIATMKWLLNETYSPLIQTENNNNLTSLKTNLMHSFRKTGKLRHKLSGQKLCLMFHIVFSVFLLSFSHSLARTLHASVQLNFNAQSCLFVVHFIYIFFFSFGSFVAPFWFRFSLFYQRRTCNIEKYPDVYLK